MMHGVKRDLVKAIAAVIVIGGLAYVLYSIRPAYAPTPSAPHVPAGETKGKPSGEKIVMRVNGEPVTESEFKLYVRSMPQQMQAFLGTPEGMRAVADEVVKLKALEQEGRRLGVERDPETAAQLDMTRSNVIATGALRKLVAKPTDAQLRAEYEKQRKSLEAIDLSHILVAYQGGQVPARSGQAPSETAAVQKAIAIATRARGGVNFSELARRESDDRNSAAQGGALGPVTPGALPPELDAVVQKLKPGEISSPVKSAFGIHVFRAGERKAQPFEAMRDALSQRVERQQIEDTVKRLQGSAKVELDPKFFPPQTPQAPAQKRGS
jgi:peptidyl-prolyl cis-trans isomerase C